MPGTSLHSKNKNPYERKFLSRERSVVNNVTAMLAYWDKNQVCRFANNAYREWFGKTKEEMIDKITMKELLGPLYEKNLPHILGALKGIPQTFEREIPLPSGGTRHAIANYIPDIENGEVKGFFVHVADVTPLKKLEFELRNKEKDLIELNESKDKLVSVITHDLKNYFTINYTTIQYLLSDYENISKQDILKYLRAMDKNNERTIYFLDELSEWVKNVLNKITFNPEKISIKKETKSIVHFFSKLLKDKNISVKTLLNKDFQAYGDLKMFRSVMRNLLSNAIKFSTMKSTINIKAILKDQMVVIGVTDTGTGITQAMKERIIAGINYDSVFGTKGEKGTGIGLRLTKEFIEKNGGKIWIESNPGKGSTFGFSIPAFIQS